MLLAKLRSGPANSTARTALEMATLGSAGCLGRLGELGSLAVGTVGDVAVWRLNGPKFAGAIADRRNRKAIVVSMNLLRVGILAVLALSIATDMVSIAVVLTALFLLGTAEVFADNASGS